MSLPSHTLTGSCLPILYAAWCEAHHLRTSARTSAHPAQGGLHLRGTPHTCKHLSYLPPSPCLLSTFVMDIHCPLVFLLPHSCTIIPSLPFTLSSPPSSLPSLLPPLLPLPPHPSLPPHLLSPPVLELRRFGHRLPGSRDMCLCRYGLLWEVA